MRGLVMVLLLVLGGCAGDSSVSKPSMSVPQSGVPTHRVEVRSGVTMEVDEETIRAACDEYRNVLVRGGQMESTWLWLWGYGVREGICDDRATYEQITRDEVGRAFARRMRPMDSMNAEALSRRVRADCETFERVGFVPNLEEWASVSYGWFKGICEVPRKRILTACEWVLATFERGGMVMSSDLWLSNFGLQMGIC